MIEIIKASAGSGKTFTLARKYIRLLFSKRDRYAYRHILAVTFTNKATDEMKGRILKELSVLASAPERSPYTDDLVPSVFEDVHGLQKEAENILSNILHDYSAFAVSTIDRFFQQTLKAFSREIGQFASYQVELDKNSLVSESVDRILDSLTEDDEDMLRWLTDSALEQIEAGGKYNLEQNLTSMAIRLKSDGFREAIEKARLRNGRFDEAEFFSKGNLAKVRTECRSLIRDYETQVRDAARAVAGVLQSAGVPVADFYRGFIAQVYNYSEAAPGAHVCMPTETFMTRAADPDLWFSKANAKKWKSFIGPVLEGPLNDFLDLFGEPYRLYCTAMIIDGQIYALGVAGELDREFKAIMKEKNVLSIDDSNTILKNIIDGSDAPFIYEKIGVRFENFLLDEFQDTSRIQWDNFCPLLKDSEAQGFDSLIVGDVKQSIYRWRGSDWNLLDKEVEMEFPSSRTDVLDTNYRSCANVVKFNNAFFRFMSGCLDRQYYGDADDGALPAAERRISDIYSDVAQKVRKDFPGNVFVDFCEKDGELAAVSVCIAELRSNGAAYGDIAVLVRQRADGAAVAGHLMAEGIPVITDDSLKVKSSVTVRRLVSLLSFTDNPDDMVNGYLARSMDIEVPKKYLSLTDLCEALLRGIMKDDDLGNEILHIQSFMDVVSDWSASNGNDLRGFLKYWADADPDIASPSMGDSVRIITVHKSKGLDFPYVIFPFAETVPLFRANSYWCRPETDNVDGNESFVAAADGIYDVNLSSSSRTTLFSGDYRKELKLQYVDNLNIMYVAMTRAVEGMTIISAMPSRKVIDAVDDGAIPVLSDFGQALYLFCEGNHDGDVRMMKSVSEEDGMLKFSLGEMSFSSSVKEEAESLGFRSGYPSFPLNPVETVYDEDGEEMDVRERGRLKFSTDALDFFDDEGHAGISASHRLKGIVLHDILSNVVVPSDLRHAVDAAYAAGELDQVEAEEAFAMLSERIASVSDRGWFPEDGAVVRNEATLIDSDGSLYRPDRIVETPDGLVVIDYKFGEHKRSYLRQIARYADLCRRMGHHNVTSYLWYVADNEIVS